MRAIPSSIILLLTFATHPMAAQGPAGSDSSRVPRAVRGKGRRAQGIAGRLSGIPDVHYGDDRHWVSGDLGISRWILTGTTRAGERLRVWGVNLLEFRAGKIVRKDSYWKRVERRAQ